MRRDDDDRKELEEWRAAGEAFGCEHPSELQDEIQERVHDAFADGVNEAYAKIDKVIGDRLDSIIREAEYALRAGETERFARELSGLDSPLKRIEQELLEDA